MGRKAKRGLHGCMVAVSGGEHFAMENAWFLVATSKRFKVLGIS